MFQTDGNKLLVCTSIEVFALVTDCSNPDKFGKKKVLPHLSEGDYHVFRRNDCDFFFLEHVLEQGYLALNFYQPKSKEKFQDL